MVKAGGSSLRSLSLTSCYNLSQQGRSMPILQVVHSVTAADSGWIGIEVHPKPGSIMYAVYGGCSGARGW